MSVDVTAAATAVGKPAPAPAIGETLRDIDSYTAAQECAAAIRHAARHAAEGDEEKLAMWLGCAESWRHLAETIQGGEQHGRPIVKPLPRQPED